MARSSVVGTAPLVFSGGSRVRGDDLREEPRPAIEAGAPGLSLGRSRWQRPMSQALAITERSRQILAKYGGPDAC